MYRGSESFGGDTGTSVESDLLGENAIEMYRRLQNLAISKGERYEDMRLRDEFERVRQSQRWDPSNPVMVGREKFFAREVFDRVLVKGQIDDPKQLRYYSAVSNSQRSNVGNLRETKTALDLKWHIDAFFDFAHPALDHLVTASFDLTTNPNAIDHKASRNIDFVQLVEVEKLDTDWDRYVEETAENVYGSFVRRIQERNG